ncbi:MAG: YicC/YloC family endoribonuclease [Pseudomonadota bacterium]
MTTLHSMTGFARSEPSGETQQWVWELRAVNHRYLDIHLRMPERLRVHEHTLRKQISGALSRGKVDCVLTRQDQGEQDVRLTIDPGVVRGLRDAARTIQQIHDGLAPQTVNDVLRWPGVIAQPDADEKAEGEALATALDAALERLKRMRAREGEHLATLLRSRCEDIAKLAATVRERRPEVIAGIRERLQERIDRVGVEVDPGRMEAELLLLAQKLDVDEELDRLDGHLNELERILAKGGPCGRKLDFLIQEFNREANTLASKSGDTLTTRAAVDMKVAIEQMREQVQNIE